MLRVQGQPRGSGRLPDPVLLGVAAVVTGLVGGYLADIGGIAVQSIARLAFTVVAEAGVAWFAFRAARRIRPGDPARRFWRAFGLAGVVWSAGYAVQTVLAVSRPDDPAALGDGQVGQAALGIGTLIVLAAMLAHPIGARSGRERLCFWLDLATVMVGVAAFGLYPAVQRAAGVTAGQVATLLQVFTGPVVLLVCTFAVVKLVLSGSPPFSRATAVLGGTGSTIGGIIQGLNPVLTAQGRANWVLAGQVVASALVLAGARVQVSLVSGGRPVQMRRRPYSLLPYVAIAATYGFLITVLTARGLSAAGWVVFGGAISSTALVVARQLAAFADNAALLADRDAKVAELHRTERSLRTSLEERDALATQLRQLAFHDSLTGLANRALFDDRLDTALARTRRDHRPVAVMIIDLDDFKPVNDNLGHAAGDELLRQVANRLRGCVRANDTVARLGGDEFAILLDQPLSDSVAEIADRVVRALQAPCLLGDSTVRVGASVGVAVGHDGTGKEFLRVADQAMYRAKLRGKNGYEIAGAARDPIGAGSAP